MLIQILSNQKSQPCDTTSVASFITCFTIKQVFKDISVIVQCCFKLVYIQLMLQQWNGIWIPSLMWYASVKLVAYQRQTIEAAFYSTVHNFKEL